jgi:hypothetical protein
MFPATFELAWTFAVLVMVRVERALVRLFPNVFPRFSLSGLAGLWVSSSSAKSFWRLWALVLSFLLVSLSDTAPQQSRFLLAFLLFLLRN